MKIVCVFYYFKGLGLLNLIGYLPERIILEPRFQGGKCSLSNFTIGLQTKEIARNYIKYRSM